MKKIFIVLITVIVSLPLFAQDYKFGKVSKAELEEQIYDLDSSANATILYKKRKSFFTYDQSGFNIVTEHQMRIKLYNSEGFDWATKQIYLSKSANNASKETVNGIKANTYNLENGKVEVTKLNKKDIFKEEKSKYTNVRKFTMPNLKEGCVVEWKYTIKSPYTTSMDDMIIQYSIPVKRYEGEVSLLEYFHFNIRTKGYYQYNLKQDVKRNSSLETSDKQYIIQENNIPALIEESYVNNINNYRSGLVFEIASIIVPGSVYESYATDWNAVVKTIFDDPSFGDELKKRSFLKEDIAVLNEKYISDKDKMTGALEFVKSKVKWNEYNGIYTDNGVKKAFKEGEGNVADINILLVTVLKELGLNANPVLLSTRANGIPLLPTRKGLNYVVASVKLNDKVFLLDATNKYSTPNVLPMRTYNWEGKIVYDSGNSESINMIPENVASLVNNINIKIDEEGYVEGMNRSTYSNYFALDYRDDYGSMTDDEILEKTEEGKEIIEIENIRINNKKEAYKPLVEMYKFTSEDLVEEIAGKLYINPLLFNTEEENQFKLEKRDYPIDFGTPFKIRDNIVIKIPEGYSVESYPESLAIGLPNNFGVYKFKIIVDNLNINIVSQLEINTAVYPANQYNDLKEFYNLMVKKNKEQIVLTKSQL